MALGVFDSGVGGLTVVKEIKKRFPTQKIIYFGDTARVPYGPRGKEVVIQFAKEDAQFLIDRGVQEIVIACNTVSALASEELKQEIKLPIWEMIAPATRGAKESTRNGNIGVIGTRGTINNHAYQKLIPEIYEQACPLFVPYVEEGEWDGNLIEELAKKYLKFVKENDIDTLILGCTHYPVLAEVIQRIVGPNVQLIHCGQEVAKELQFGEEGEDEYYLSDVTDKYIEIAERILGTGVKIERVKL